MLSRPALLLACVHTILHGIIFSLIVTPLPSVHLAHTVTRAPPLQAYLNKLAGQAAQLKWRKDEQDTGSPRIVVAILTEKIVYLTKHMQQHPHDYHSRRGLITMVNKRRRWVHAQTSVVKVCRPSCRTYVTFFFRVR